MSRFTVFKEWTFDAAHSLPHLPESHKCHRVHGHTYHVTVFAEGGTLADGFLVDYAVLDDVFQRRVHAVVDHRYLNEVCPVPHTTSELLAKWIFEVMRKEIPTVCGVRVKETATAGAEFRGEVT